MNYDFLINTMLFRGMSRADAEGMLSCLGAHEKKYVKDEIIYHAGECVESMGLVISGSVDLVIDDMWGNSTILGRAAAGQLFAETYACVPGEPLMVNAVANEKCEVLFLNAGKIMTTCRNACPFHSMLIRNLLKISSVKNLELSRRSVYTSSRSIRVRLTSYLSGQSKRAGSYQFRIPFNRQQLADYLGVDRSAMSNELSKMQRDGLITYEKNNFKINTDARM